MEGPLEKKMKGFKSLIAWQKAYALTLDIYKVSGNFPKEEIYAMTSQIRRAAVSIPSNIAEGYERNHRKEYLHFLSVAKGSLGEIETQLLLAKDLNYIKESLHAEIDAKRSEVGRLLTGLLKSLSK
jgi:four helix bundle protein